MGLHASGWALSINAGMNPHLWGLKCIPLREILFKKKKIQNYDDKIRYTGFGEALKYSTGNEKVIRI